MKFDLCNRLSRPIQQYWCCIVAFTTVGAQELRSTCGPSIIEVLFVVMVKPGSSKLVHDAYVYMQRLRIKLLPKT